jgi:hypothetical protein
VLLVEVLDGAGSDVADASERSALLLAAGARPRAALLAAANGNHPEDVRHAAGRAGLAPIVRFGAGRADLEALRSMTGHGRFDLALVAAAGPVGAKVARALSPIVATRGWPTGVAPVSGWITRLGRVGSGGGTDLPADADETRTPAGIAWSSVDCGRLRGRPTLWDGEYVLAPLAPSGDDGAEMIAAFAHAARRRPSLDLVVLAEQQPTLEREARAHGIAARVHCVGPAPREAEWTWWSHASVALLGARGPLSGGLVLRGLAAGCPLLVTWEGSARVVATWLERAGCAPWSRGGAGTWARALADVLERGPAVEAARARGRALAAAHEPAHMAPRLAAALVKVLPTPFEPTRHAA